MSCEGQHAEPELRDTDADTENVREREQALGSHGEEANGSIEYEEAPEAKSIRVVVRVRPLLSSEIENGAKQSSLVVDATNCAVHVDELEKKSSKKKIGSKGSGLKRHSFAFDSVLDGSTSQSDMYERTKVDDMIGATLDGYDATIFAYGQTGSGKTYTMEGFDYNRGPSEDISADIDGTSEERLGIVPQAAKSLFKHLRQRSKNESLEFRVRCSYIQIYNEKILDLLGAEGKGDSDALLEADRAGGLKMRFNASSQQFYVERLCEVECSNPRDLQSTFERGVRAKAMGAHKLNASSSRSHCVLTVLVDTIDPAQPQETKHTGRLSLIDLAGSERVSMTGAEGRTLKEATCINKSLFALRNVIGAISRQQEQGEDSTEQHHIPFRDSKLTSLLKHSLGGTSLTLMIACVSPSDSHCDENLSTLAYASRASKIKNRPTRNEDPKSKLIRKLQAEIRLLRKQLRHAQKMSSLALETNSNAVGNAGAISSPLLGACSSPSSSSSPSKEVLKQVHFLKQELLNSISMMKKMHEIELELRSRMEAAEQRADELERSNAKINAENQALREHENVLIHLLNSNDVAAPPGAVHAEDDLGSQKRRQNASAASAALAKELIDLKRRNAELQDTVATLGETNRLEQPQGSRGYKIDFKKKKEHCENVANPAGLRRSPKKAGKNKRRRRPQVMSVDQLRNLLSGPGGGDGSNNNLEDLQKAQVSDEQKKTSHGIFVSPLGTSRRVILSEETKIGPHRPLLVKTGSKSGFIALGGNLPTTSRSEDMEQAGEQPAMPLIQNVSPTHAKSSQSSDTAKLGPMRGALGSSSPLEKMSAITELLRAQSKIKTGRRTYS